VKVVGLNRYTAATYTLTSVGMVKLIIAIQSLDGKNKYFEDDTIEILVGPSHFQRQRQNKKDCVLQQPFMPQQTSMLCQA